MGDKYPKYYPASATLDETRRACKDEQQDETSQLRALEGIANEKPDGTKVNLNEATFERMDSVLDILDELLFFDVSTVAGSTAAAAANHDHTPIGGPGKQFSIWVENKLTPVQVLGKTT